MAILCLSVCHNGNLMAPKLFPHEYLLAPMIWSNFYHFRISGSIICRQLFHSFTDVMKGASPFVTLHLDKFCLNLIGSHRAGSSRLLHKDHPQHCKNISSLKSEMCGNSIFCRPDEMKDLSDVRFSGTASYQGFLGKSWIS